MARHTAKSSQVESSRLRARLIRYQMLLFRSTECLVPTALALEGKKANRHVS